MSDGSSSERRQHERFELSAQVALRRAGGVETFAVINISAGGVLLRNDRSVDVAAGEDLYVTFDIPELALAFAINATVVRVVHATTKPGVVAAMWSSSDAAASAALAQLLWSLQKS
jgi:hypothetical protein